MELVLKIQMLLLVNWDNIIICNCIINQFQLHLNQIKKKKNGKKNNSAKENDETKNTVPPSLPKALEDDDFHLVINIVSIKTGSKFKR